MNNARQFRPSKSELVNINGCSGISSSVGDHNKRKENHVNRESQQPVDRVSPGNDLGLFVDASQVFTVTSIFIYSFTSFIITF